MSSDESRRADSRPEVIDEFVISKWGQALQNSIRIYCTKPQALSEPCRKPMRVTVLWCRVWCLDLPSHPFTLEPCLLQGWISRGSPENSNFKSLSPASSAWLIVWSLSGESPICDSVFTSYAGLRAWLLGSWGQYGGSIRLVNPGSWAMFISFGCWEHLSTCQRYLWVSQDGKLRWPHQWSQPPFWMMLCVQRKGSCNLHSRCLSKSKTGKGSERVEQEGLEKRFLQKELLLISPLGAGVELLQDNTGSYSLQ